MILALFLLLLLFVSAVILRYVTGSILFPGALFNLYWGTWLLLALLIPGLIIETIGVFWIVLSCLFLSMGSFIGYKVNLVIIDRGKKELLKDVQVFMKLITLCIALGFCASFIYIYEWDGTLDRFQSLFEIAHYYSRSRYSDPIYREPELATFFTIFVYMGAMLSGIVLSLNTLNKKQKLLAWLSLLPAILVTILLSTRASFLFSIVILASFFIAFKIYYQSGRIGDKNSGSHLFIKGALSLLLSITVYLLGQFMRSGEFSVDLLMDVALAKLVIAFFGSIEAFTVWFSTEWQSTFQHSYGTFLIPGASLLLPELKTKFTSVFIGKGSFFYGGTTVFTVFRQIINDFGLVGSLVYCFIIGCVSGWAYRQSIHRGLLGTSILAGFYMFLFASFTTNPFRYNVITIAFLWVFMIQHSVLKKNNKNRDCIITRNKN